MKIYKRFLVLVCFFVLMPCLVFAYHSLFQDSGSSFVVEKRFDLPVDFFVDSGGDIDILEDACDEWNSVDDVEDLCGDLDLSDSDIDENNFNALVSGNNGQSEFIFDDTGDILDNLGFPSNVLGVSLNSFNVATGEIVESTIILNTSISSSSTFDPRATSTHEIGHSLGLAHVPTGGINTAFVFPLGLDPVSPSGTPTMFPFNIPTNASLARTLEPDDIAGIFVLYGE